MDIDIRVTIDDDEVTPSGMSFGEPEIQPYAEMTLVHLIVAEIPFVKSAVVLRPEEGLDAEGGVGPDESTRQER